MKMTQKLAKLLASAALASAQGTRREVSKDGVYQPKAPQALIEKK